VCPSVYYSPANSQSFTLNLRWSAEVCMTEPRVRKIITLITHDLQRKITTTEMAQSVNLSPSRLRHLFRDEMGVSLRQYLKAQRMLKARQLLETTFLNVQEIMFRVGFTDKSHFARDFKKVYGFSPLRYRTQFLRDTKNFSRAAGTAHN
jgi:transcriptional regulator GlxA family with amidase domain